MPRLDRAPKIVVIGSINQDLVLQCAALPRPGETVSAKSFSQVSGGKGANQAVSAALAGGQVSMVGRVGDDAYADQLVSGLLDRGIDCDSIKRTPGYSSGIAVINVDDSGQNAITIVGGANDKLSSQDIDSVEKLIQASDVVLLQLEIPLSTVVHVIKLAKRFDTRVILDPAPAPHDYPAELLEVDLICPNEREAAILAGWKGDLPANIDQVAMSLFERGAKHVVVTLGERGSYRYDSRGGRLISAFETSAVDTTAAGDAFIGAAAVHWAENGELDQAIEFGNAAGAIAAARLGAQPSMGMRNEIEKLWNSVR